MGDDLMTLDQGSTLTVQQVKQQAQLLHKLLGEAMVDGEDYGTIQGCGPKPALFKSGAEKVCFLFRIAPEIDVEDLSEEGPPRVIRYRVKVRGMSPSGKFLGMGVGECSTAEEKYAWRRIVSMDEWDATDETNRRIKYYKDGEAKQVRTNAADQGNTVLKMAKKRGMTDMVLTVTAASNIFSQADDTPEGEDAEAGPKVQQPKAKAKGKGKGKGAGKAAKKDKETPLQWSGKVDQVEFDKASGTTAKGEWAMHLVHCQQDMRFATFSKSKAQEAEAARLNDSTVVIEYTKGDKGKQLVSIEVVEE